MARWYQTTHGTCRLNMKSKSTELEQRYLILLKQDATSLVNRVSERRDVYMETFSLKRDRTVFMWIFRSRYDKSTMFDLSHYPIEIIELAESFYSEADELYWYLMNTQDMPNTIENEVIRLIHHLKTKHSTLCSYIDAQLAGEDLSDIVESDKPFYLEGEKQAVESREVSPDELLNFEIDTNYLEELSQEAEEDNDV